MGPMLLPGSTVAVLAPAGRFVAERLEAGLQTLRDWDYEVVLGPNLYAVDGYNAGTAAERAADLNWALGDPGIDAVWLARGGFGCAHLLDRLELGSCQPKPVIGFSDATALMVTLWQCGWVQEGGALIHGPVVHTLGAAGLDGCASPVLVDADSRDALARLLDRGTPVSHAGRAVAEIGPPVHAPVVGGNLTVLASLCGTPWQLKAEGAIVLLEDVGEAPYRLDRCVTQLLSAGSLEGAVGIGLGDFSGCDTQEADGRRHLGVELVAQRLRVLGVPVVMGLSFGHGPRNLAWPMGARGSLGPTGLSWL